MNPAGPLFVPTSIIDIGLDFPDSAAQSEQIAESVRLSAVLASETVDETAVLLPRIDVEVDWRSIHSHCRADPLDGVKHAFDCLVEDGRFESVGVGHRIGDIRGEWPNRIGTVSLARGRETLT